MFVLSRIACGSSLHALIVWFAVDVIGVGFVCCFNFAYSVVLNLLLLLC